MTTVRDLHNKAMRNAHLALIARNEGKAQEARELAQEALKYEREAAYMVSREESAEPTRSILFRSAGSLALQAGRLKESQRLIAEGLAGYPPPTIERELKDIMEQINFESHLAVRDIELEDNDLQISLSGEAVGSGMILYGELRERLDAFIKQLDRTVQRILKRPYQRAGKVSKKYQLFAPALSVSRANSFATTIRLAVQKGTQMDLMINAAAVIDDILMGLGLINSGCEGQLEERINDRAYYIDFISFAKIIAPDGDMIKMVGFTSSRDKVGFTREESDILFEPGDARSEESDSGSQEISIKGRLDFAKFRESNIIGLTTGEGKRYSIEVEEGMDDFVRRHFNYTIEIQGIYDGKKVYPRPDSIKRIEDDDLE